MTRLIINYRKDAKKEFVNIPCDSIREENGIVYAYNTQNLVAIADIGIVDLLYLSQQGGE